MSASAGDHKAAIDAQFERDRDEVATAADIAHAVIAGEATTFLAHAGFEERPPPLAGVPVDEPPAYVPPIPSAPSPDALIPDSPLVDAFDDAPLWQN